MSSESQKLADAIREIVSERLDAVEILSVEVEPAEDFDGEPILRVRIEFDADNAKLDAKRVLGLVRRLRPRLHDVGEDRFPLLSFVSRDDTTGRSPEAA